MIRICQKSKLLLCGLPRCRKLYTDIHVSKEVEEAIRSKKPVVALESTIISHGMPYPRNMEVALELEHIIRNAGAVPATTAVLNGFCHVGLHENQIAYLAKPKETKDKILKASRRDIAYVCANRLTAATTVSSTMILSSMAGIRVFATGGIGGVHRGAEVSMDISADLKELSQTPVTVVCSGVKSILDIPKTLEVLEYMGVPVFSYKSEAFPAFFTNNSGCKSPLVARSSLDIARAMACQDDLFGLHEQGMLVAVPNPSPADTAAIEEAINTALRDAANDHVTGAAVTPYVLARVEQLTQGKSLDANVALVKNNAKVAADIAIQYSALSYRKQFQVPVGPKATEDSTSTSLIRPAALTNDLSSSTSTSNISSSSAPIIHRPEMAGKPTVLVIGGAVVDQVMTPKKASHLLLHTSNPGSISINYGGVGRNIAEAIGRLGDCNVSLLSAVGGDAQGVGLLRHASEAGVDVSLVIRGGADDRTAVYAAVHDHTGDLVVAIADMDIFARALDPAVIQSLEWKIKRTQMVVTDGNLTPECFAAVANSCESNNIPLFFEPTSVHKCTVPVLAKSIHKVSVIKPNVAELFATVKCLLDNDLIQTSSVQKMVTEYYEHGGNKWRLNDVRSVATTLLNAMLMQTKHKSPTTVKGEGLAGIRVITGKHVIVSLGDLGVLWVGPSSVLEADADTEINDRLSSKHMLADPIPPNEIINTSGAGDTFCAGFINSLLLNNGEKGARGAGGPTVDDIKAGMVYSGKAIRSASTVPLN